MRIAWKFGNPPPTHTQTGQWTSVSTKVGRILEEAVKQQLRDLQGALESVSNVSYKKKKNHLLQGIFVSWAHQRRVNKKT